jgi:hypothetical protein
MSPALSYQHMASEYPVRSSAIIVFSASREEVHLAEMAMCFAFIEDVLLGGRVPSDSVAHGQWTFSVVGVS